METKNIICKYCGKEFQIQKYTIKYKSGREIQRFPLTKYCSSKCCSRNKYLKNIEYFKNYWLTRPNLWAWKKSRICEVCGLEYKPKSPKAKTCSRKCSSKRWKLLNPEKNRETNRLSAQRCRKRDPERYRLYVKNRTHLLREASGGVSGRNLSTAFTLKDWEEIKEKYNQCCVLCDASDLKLTIDHIIPLSKGGRHKKENIQPLCHSCNSWKKDKILLPITG